MNQPSGVVVNGRSYAMPATCAVVICLDGCEPAYLEAASAAGLTPNLDRIRAEGTDRLSHSVIPSFTNPNNLSIATGCPPAVHGICGNYLYDPDTGTEVMMNDIRFLRAPTLFSAFQEAGARVAVVTAKDKLRALLGAGLDLAAGSAVCFSAERSGETSRREHGIDGASDWLGLDVPDVYSAALSEFVFAAGVRLLADWAPDVMYLTTTDYIQHKHAPGDPVADRFYGMFDGYLGQLHAAGAAIVITGDHGMNPKHHADGTPHVVYVQDLLDSWLGTGAARVILPITDPYVVHHGALGSFATVYLPQDVTRADIVERLARVPGIELVLGREEACDRFDLPPDRIGDVVLTSDETVTIGTSEDRHDLELLTEPLRSHGGLHEQTVPFIVNRKMPLGTAPDLRNYDAFQVATQAAAAGDCA